MLNRPGMVELAGDQANQSEAGREQGSRQGTEGEQKLKIFLVKNLKWWNKS